MNLEPAFSRGAPAWPIGALARVPAEAPDPVFAIPDGCLQKGQREIGEKIYLRETSSEIPAGRQEPLDIKPDGKPKPSRKWKVILAFSFALHACAAVFLMRPNNDDVLIAGAEQASIAMLGGSPEDQVSAGEDSPDMEVTNVTLIEMVTPKLIEATTVEPLPVQETAEPVETVVAEAAVPEPIQAVESEPVTTEPVESASPVQAKALPEHPSAPQMTVADLVPEVLSVERAVPLDPDNTVQKPVEVAEVTPVEPTVVEPEPVKPDTPVKPLEEPKPQAVKPVEKPAPVKTAKPVEKKQLPKKVVEKKAVDKKAVQKADALKEKQKQAAKAGNGGQNQSDTKRGSADGQAEGKSAAKSKGGAQKSAAGNAAVSNYPGKVVSKLRRALRYPSEARSSNIRGEVQVSFTVSSGGSVGGIRIVRSSGSPILDKAAMDTVRRAAPFPAIPADAGRSSWPFTVPLAFMR